MGFVITLIALGIVIFVHELGHMIAAKRAGIGVLEFAIGMGPKVFSRKVDETLYSLRLFPLGGFVKLAGFDDEDDAEVPPEINYFEKSIAQRMITICAGSAMNLVLGFLIFVFIYSVLGVPEMTSAVKEVFPKSPAAEAGLKNGDIIVAINGNEVQKPQADIIKTIHGSAGTALTFRIQRGSETQTLDIVPKLNDKHKVGLIGVRMGDQIVRYNPVMSIVKGGQATYRNIKMVFVNLGLVIRGTVSVKELAGPVGIVQFASSQLDQEDLRQRVLGFLSIMSMISISLGVINLFPFPVLDGGHAMFLTIEAIRGKRLSKRSETLINNTGVAILMTLMAVIIFNDIVHWQERGVLLKKIVSGE